MAEEVKDPVVDEKDNIDYIEAIQKMKENSVPKDKYEKLEREKKELLEALVDGKQIESDNKPAPADIGQLRQDLYDNPNITNLDYVKKSLELRNRLIDEGEPDPFLPWGEKILPTADDVESANRVAEAFQYCIDYAEGDPDIFTSELQRITVDAPIMRAKNIRR